MNFAISLTNRSRNMKCHGPTVKKSPVLCSDDQKVLDARGKHRVRVDAPKLTHVFFKLSFPLPLSSKICSKRNIKNLSANRGGYFVKILYENLKIVERLFCGVLLV